jgi:hypothetical protein
MLLTIQALLTKCYTGQVQYFVGKARAYPSVELSVTHYPSLTQKLLYRPSPIFAGKAGGAHHS